MGLSWHEPTTSLGQDRRHPGSHPLLKPCFKRDFIVVTKPPHAHGRSGLILPSHMGGPPGSIWAHMGVKLVQLGSFSTAQGSE